MKSDPSSWYSLNVLDSSQREALRKLEESLYVVTAQGLLDFLDSPPIIRRMQSHRYR